VSDLAGGLVQVQGLDLALPIDRQDQCLVRRVEVKAHDVADFGDELRSADSHKV
jgi:hypothetical protein